MENDSKGTPSQILVSDPHHLNTNLELAIFEDYGI